MSARKYAADRIAKTMLPKEDDEEEEFANSEEEDFSKNVEFNPSKMRSDAIPAEGKYLGKKVTRQEMENLEENQAASDEEEEEEEDEEEEIENGSDSDLIADNDQVEDLTKELNELEQEDSTLITSLRKQQEDDQKIAKGVESLQQQFSILLGLRLKMQPLLTSANSIPPKSIDGDQVNSPYKEAASDPEVASLMKEVEDSISILNDDFKGLKSSLQTHFAWDDGQENSQRMMQIISHWSQKQRLGAGMKKGSVINRPIEQQISSLLNDRSTLIQPTRHRNVEVFGLSNQPEVLSSVYNDTDWYNRLLRDYVTEKDPKAKVVVHKSKKERQKGRQISYEAIPQLQNFMTPTMKPIPDYADALFMSLLK